LDKLSQTTLGFNLIHPSEFPSVDYKKLFSVGPDACQNRKELDSKKGKAEATSNSAQSRINVDDLIARFVICFKSKLNFISLILGLYHAALRLKR
jgi:hypothetical protein